MRLCDINECGSKHHARGYCTKHYQRFKNHGVTERFRGVERGGSHKHPLYNTYCMMLARCYKPNSTSYKWYGAKGIGVCLRWRGKNGFINFVCDMGDKPSANYSLDRIDNDKGYSPDNCRWVNHYNQNGHKVNNNPVPGVGWHKQRGKFRARIKVNGKEISLGLYSTHVEAVKARKQAEKVYIVE